MTTQHDAEALAKELRAFVDELNDGDRITDNELRIYRMLQAAAALLESQAAEIRAMRAIVTAAVALDRSWTESDGITNQDPDEPDYAAQHPDDNPFHAAIERQTHCHGIFRDAVAALPPTPGAENA